MVEFNAPYIIILVVLFVAFGFQVKDSFEKFINKKTTWSMETIPVQSHRFPVLSICPGYRDGRDIKDYFHSYFDDHPDEGVCRTRRHTSIFRFLATFFII